MVNNIGSGNGGRNLVKYEKKLLYYPRGSVWMCDLSQIKSTEGVQSGNRPAVVISNNLGNISNKSVLIVLITSNIEKRKTGINVEFVNNRDELNVVLCNQVHTISKECLLRYLGIIPDAVMLDIEAGIKTAFGMKTLEADISILEHTVSKIISSYERKMLFNQQLDSITSEQVNNIATQLEELFKDVVIPLGRAHDSAPLLTSFAQSVDKQVSIENNTNSQSNSSQYKSEIGLKPKTQLKKPRGFWTKDRKIEFIRDSETMSFEEMREKWDMQSAKTVQQMLSNFKRSLRA